jgi:hypothetical protein
MTSNEHASLVWRKSSYSGGGGAQCVELASLPTGKAVRDSKNASGPMLIFDSGSMTAFLADVQSGQHDLS